VAAVALGVGVLGGGGDDGGSGGEGGGGGGSAGGPGSGGGPGIEFEPFSGARAFTVDVPVGSQPIGAVEDQLKTVIRTELQSSDGKINVQIVQEAQSPPADRVAEALAERSVEPGYKLINGGELRTLDGREAELFAYETSEEGFPATVVNYAFNDGGSGWRTRAAVADSVGESSELAEKIATRMATTLQSLNPA
jgi:hypothetical protein